jgi:hypothetical protein
MKILSIAAMLLAGVILVGCDDKPATPAGGGDTGDKTKAAMDSAGKQATDAAGAASNAAGDAMAKLKETLGGDPQEMYDKAMAFVKENKIAEATAILAKFESAKSMLPADWAKKVEDLKALIDKAKAAAGAIPGGIPGAGK